MNQRPAATARMKPAGPRPGRPGPAATTGWSGCCRRRRRT
ncbi:hypothetical protein D556_0211 [Bordetella holmesii 41130]|nr:hypothetical protein D560_0212 [Bordetella holmesii ATCC 51541]EWM48350.1 hypothetical protein D556_0211 [Bordetella holmesii 41130]